MTVQMIRRDIQNCADLRCKFFDRLELKAADLRHRHSIICHLWSRLGIRIADIADDIDLRMICLHNRSEQARRRRLSICTGHGKDIALSTFIRELHFPPDANAFPLHCKHDGQIARHTRTHDHQIQLFHFCFRKLTEYNTDLTSCRKLRQKCLLILFCISIIENYFCAPCEQQMCRSDSTDAGSEYEHAFLCQFHFSSSFLFLHSAANSAPPDQSHTKAQ